MFAAMYAAFSLSALYFVTPVLYTAKHQHLQYCCNTTMEMHTFKHQSNFEPCIICIITPSLVVFKTTFAL